MKARSRVRIAFLLLSESVATASALAGTVVLPDVAGVSVSLPLTTMQEQRFAATVRQKYDFSCGSAAVATLLTYQYGSAVSEEQVFEEMFRRGDQARIRRDGFSLLDMKVYLDAHGFRADGFKVTLDKLTEAGLPAIALISEKGYNHFVVIKGVAAGRVLVGDPARGARTVVRAEFERIWRGGVLLVVTAEGRPARFNSPLDWGSAPLSPLSLGVMRDGLAHLVIPKFGPGGF